MIFLPLSYDKPISPFKHYALFRCSAFLKEHVTIFKKGDIKNNKNKK